MHHQARELYRRTCCRIDWRDTSDLFIYRIIYICVLELFCCEFTTLLEKNDTIGSSHASCDRARVSQMTKRWHETQTKDTFFKTTRHYMTSRPLLYFASLVKVHQQLCSLHWKSISPASCDKTLPSQTRPHWREMPALGKAPRPRRAPAPRPHGISSGTCREMRCALARSACAT